MSDRTGSWWAASLAAAAPAVGLAAGGGALGIDAMPGVALASGAAAYLALDLAFLQPAIDERLLGSDSLAGLTRAFLQRALAARTAADVAVELASTVSQALGARMALLIVPSPEGGIWVLGGDDETAGRLGDAEAAFAWLGERTEPVDRAALAGLGEVAGARAAAELLDRLEGEALLPLRHRGLLLGIAVLSAPRRSVPEPARRSFYRALAAHATVALANTYLDVQAHGRGTLSKAMDLATAMQEALLPDDRPLRLGRLTVRGLYRPVSECGGDFWAVQELGGGRVLVLVGDATGHGAAPAMLTAVVRGAVDAARVVHGPALDPAALLTSLNHAVFHAGRMRYLMTAFAAVIDPAAGEMRFANAGQNFPYVVAPANGVKPRLESLVARGNTLGAAAEVRYTAARRPLVAGERLVLYSDGLTDAGSPGAEPFGERRFRGSLAAHAAEPAARLAEQLLADVDAYLNGRPVYDDITVVALDLAAAGEPAAPAGGRGGAR